MATQTIAPTINTKPLRLESTVISRHSLNPDLAPLPSMNRSEQLAVQSRKQQIADGWSKQERAARLRSGTARRTWLFKSIEQCLQPNRNLQECSERKDN